MNNYSIEWSNKAREDLFNHFTFLPNVSYEAASIRLKTLSMIQSKWRSREEKEFDDIIVAKYAKIIDQIAPKMFNRYEFEYEYERQLERDSWFAVR